MNTVKPAGDGLTLYIVTVVMLVLSWVTVVARIWIRRMIKQFGLDDALMVFGLVSRINSHLQFHIDRGIG